MKMKIKPDFDKAKGIMKMVQGRKEFVKTYGEKIFPTIICENYYEIIKELTTALFLTKGIKFIGEYAHKEMMEETVKTLNLEESFSVFLQDFRTRRNGSLYYGEQFEKNYLENNLKKIISLIEQIEKHLNKELDSK